MSVRYVCPALVALLGLATTGCYHSLHAPRPLAKNAAQVGVHVGVFAEDTGNLPDRSAPAFVVTTRYGLGSGVELGLDVGTAGPVASGKYGFLDQDAPLQISAVVSAGLAFWNFPVFGGGLLVGYSFGDVFTPYVGYRHAGVYVDELEAIGNAIGGFDVRLSPSLGLLIEGSFGLDPGHEGPSAHVSGGVTYSF